MSDRRLHEKIVYYSIPYMDRVRYLSNGKFMFYWRFGTRFDCQPFEILQADVDTLSVF